MFKKAVIVLVVVVAAVLLFAATKPDAFRVQRSISVKAPPEKVFALINDFHSWGLWSPFEKLDPSMKKTYSGAGNGTGAVYEWEGNSKSGAGRMEILQTTVPSKVTVKLDFIKPFEGHNTAEFTMEPQGNSTNVTWAMYGASPYIAKVMTLFFSMDKVVGKDFETGLSNIKALAEK
jgi:hypothetical protein